MENRAEFSKTTKLKAWKRSGGRCENCTAEISTGNIEYHHAQECTFGGGSAVANCVVLCKTCHRHITNSRAKVIARSNRQRNKQIGIKRQAARPFPLGKASRFKKKITGEVVKR